MNRGALVLRAAICSISLGVTGAVAFACHLTWTHASGPARHAWRAQQPVSVIQNWHPNGSVFFRSPESFPNDARVHLASLETETTAATEYIPISMKQGFVSFNDRFAGGTSVIVRAVNAVTTEPVLPRHAAAAETERRVGALPNAPARSASPAAGPLAPEFATAARPPFSSGIRAAKARQASLAPPDKANKTAFYDISAQVVYLPDGRRLEAHSGLGSYMDNARYAHIKNKGPTPPNTYRQALRENLFQTALLWRLPNVVMAILAKGMLWWPPVLR
jgi:hypothetical protein